MQSSLNKRRTDALPNIYRRRQIGPSVVFGFGGRDGANNPMPKHKVKIEEPTSDITGRLPITGNGTVEVEIISREYDNPEISDTRWVNGKLEWDDRHATIINHGIAKDVVMALNHPHRRDATGVGRLAKQYNGSLVDFNICWKCRYPIKARTACVPRGATEEQIRDERNWLKRKTRKGSIAVFGNQGKKIASDPRMAVEYNTTSEVKNITYADVRPYFDVKQLPNGKFYFFLEDGTGIKKGVRLGKAVLGTREFTRFEYFNLETGEPCKNYAPPVSFRLFNVKCECKLRPDQR